MPLTRFSEYRPQLSEYAMTPFNSNWIACPECGLGFATEGYRAVIHITNNPASGNVLRKLGFQNTGKTAHRHSKVSGEAAACAMYEWAPNGAG